MSPIHHDNRRLDSVVGKTIFEYADALQVRVPTSCNRSGECHECIVEIKRGFDSMNTATPEESFLRGNYRLACQAYVTDPDADVEFVILRRQPRILTQSIKRRVPVDPSIARRGDGVYFGEERIDSYRGKIYGLAVDVGTTTVVMNLVDLESGAVVHTASFENPQRFGGSDIMHRISYDSGEFHGELRQVMLSSLNFEIGWMARELGFHRRHIYEAVIVGNSTMRDIVFGIDVQSIGEKPYKSVTEHEALDGKRQTTALHASADEFGLRIFPGGHVYGGPLIASHVGADVTADLLAVGMDEQEEVVMLLDVGTNTEVVVGNKDRIVAASCPAGPAFEGGEVTYGMPGYVGAVESVKLSGGACEWSTIGGAEPQGICGSGLIDLLADLRHADRMNRLGVFADGAQEFTFIPERGMTLSRADISALAQAKSANFCGQYIVLRNYGSRIDRIDNLYLAGGFANYIDTRNAIDIGFIADIPQSKIVKVGNASLEGATVMLINAGMRGVAEEMVSRVEHIELETTPDFFDIFVDGCMFDPMDMTLR